MTETKTPRAPRVRLELNEDLIAVSKKADSSHCMIADALKAALPDATHVSVDLQTIRFSDPRRGLRYTYLTPRTAQVALVNFDQGRKVEPFTFQLRGGQVTSAGRRKAGQPKKPTAEKRKGTKMKMHDLKQQRIVNRDKTKGEVPDRVGGKTPPTTPFARRRAFGLRALER